MRIMVEGDDGEMRPMELTSDLDVHDEGNRQTVTLPGPDDEFRGDGFPVPAEAPVSALLSGLQALTAEIRDGRPLSVDDESRALARRIVAEQDVAPTSPPNPPLGFAELDQAAIADKLKQSRDKKNAKPGVEKPRETWACAVLVDSHEGSRWMTGKGVTRGQAVKEYQRLRQTGHRVLIGRLT